MGRLRPEARRAKAGAPRGRFAVELGLWDVFWGFLGKGACVSGSLKVSLLGAVPVTSEVTWVCCASIRSAEPQARTFDYSPGLKRGLSPRPPLKQQTCPFCIWPTIDVLVRRSDHMPNLPGRHSV